VRNKRNRRERRREVCLIRMSRRGQPIPAGAEPYAVRNALLQAAQRIITPDGESFQFAVVTFGGQPRAAAPLQGALSQLPQRTLARLR
jgi:hypothetical protein